VADWLASVFKDRKSYSGFKARCEEAWWGELSGSAALGQRAGDGPEGEEPGSNLHGRGASKRIIVLTFANIIKPIE
jgi:hypothetical protein